MQTSNPLASLFVATTLMIGGGIASAQQTNRPWMNAQLSPEDRAELVLKELTLNEKLALIHGNGMAGEPQWQMPLTHLANGGVGYTQVKNTGKRIGAEIAEVYATLPDGGD